MAAKSIFRGHSFHIRSSGEKKDKKAKEDGKRAAQEDADVFKKQTEEEKHFVAQCCDDYNKAPLSPVEIAKDPADKHVGHSSKHLRCCDFKLITTLGTGTFARVWLASIYDPRPCDKDKVVALKVLKKIDIIKLKQIEHVNNERDILASVAGHPFITTLVASFQDSDTLYMILDYCPGGEVFSYLRKAHRFSEYTSQFYAAEVVLIFEYLHHQESVAYRDLKPENILIDADGHLRLVDFGFAKKLDNHTTYTLCGTPEYLAPESIKSKGHGCAVDWWALGILIFEFLVGQPPFWDENQMQMYEQICSGKIQYPSGMTPKAKDIIGQLCTVDPTHRLGNLPGGAKDVKAHPWFEHIEWKKLYNRELDPPIKPKLSGPADTRNFNCYDDTPPRKSLYTAELQKKYDHLFACF